MNKNKYGRYKYYKLFNYFWSSFFTILIPLLENSIKYRNMVTPNIDYKLILKNLDSILKYIYSDEFINDYNKPSKNKNYYKALKNSDLNEVYILTTNYTPFLEKYFSVDKISYLAGKMNLFENSEKNIVFEFPQKDIIDFFPFLMTQAPIKPILHPMQIDEYYKGINNLNNSDYLVIIGYSLCDNDNHILTIIKDFYLKNKKIIYCYYVKTNDKSINSKELIKEKTNEISDILKLPNSNNLTILINNYEDVNCLYQEIRKYIYN